MNAYKASVNRVMWDNDGPTRGKWKRITTRQARRRLKEESRRIINESQMLQRVSKTTSDS